jgi:hypothetical protein
MNIGYPQAIRSLAPTAEWTMTDITNYSTLQWFSPEVTKPTESQAQAEITRLESEKPLKDCKAEAKRRIAESDWSVLPDVGISNVAQFETYRAALRELIKNPVATPSFPTEPEPVWL